MAWNRNSSSTCIRIYNNIKCKAIFMQRTLYVFSISVCIGPNIFCVIPISMPTSALMAQSNFNNKDCSDAAKLASFEIEILTGLLKALSKPAQTYLIFHCQ